MALCENPVWVFRQENGYYCLCHMQDATGIVVDGQVYHIHDRGYLNGVETVLVKDMSAISSRIKELEGLLSAYDYIGVKIATGRATIDSYAEQIVEMTVWADEISSLRALLQDPNAEYPAAAPALDTGEDEYDDDESDEDYNELEDIYGPEEPDDEEY